MVDPALDTEGLCEKLTMAGLEVEDAHAAAPPFSGVVVGRIDRVDPHPAADRLRVCLVDIGATESLQIVCGAPNAAAGMKVPCATIGAQLPGGLVIAKATMRGVESHGMLCSARELGIDDDASGLLPLAADAVVGSNVRDALALDDTLITLKLTPNRADCLSILGIAREVAAVTGAALVPLVDVPSPVTSEALRPVRVEDPDACPRFVSRTIEGIDPKAPTPAWMKERLERSGIRSISAVVDVTNYVMLELGQPLHAYDERLLEGAIVVRFARPGEKLTLLNEQVLDLEPDLLLVADERKPLGLAGIMGGEHSGINDTTTTVLLEGAFWSPAVIQGKSRRLGFSSDAGYRFERGVDFAGCRRAVERATRLITELCGGRAGPLTDIQGMLPPREKVRVRPARVERLLGIAVPGDTIAGVFEQARLCLRAYRRGLSRHSSHLPIRPRDRGGLRRGNRAPSRLRCDPGGGHRTSADDASRRRSEAPDDHAQATARRLRLAGSDHVQLRRFRVGVRALPQSRRADCAHRRVESHRESPRCDAHYARRRAHRCAAHEPRAPAGPRPRVRSRPLFLAHDAGL